MITATLNDIVNSMGVFNKIMQQPVNGSTAFKIARLARELNKEIETFNQEKDKLLNKYGQKDENGELETDENNNVKISPENIAKINEEFNSLLSTTVEINCDKFSVNELNNLTITPQEVINLQTFLND